MPLADFKAIQQVIKKQHGCDSKHVRSVPVRETLKNGVSWEGVVEVFNLDGHPKAKRCYAWVAMQRTGARIVTVLEIAPVDSPEMAVRIALAASSGNAQTAT